MYFEVLNLCLHQPLKCINQNSSARTSLLLFPQFSSFHVVGKKTQSPLLILQWGKTKHTNINKAVNHPLSPCHQVPTKPPRQKVSAEGSGPPGPQSPPWWLLTSPPLSVRAGCLGITGRSLPAQPLSHGRVCPWQQDLSWLALQIHTVMGTISPLRLSPRG